MISPIRGDFTGFRVQVLGHSNSPYTSVSGHARLSPGRGLPPEPGDRRSLLVSPYGISDRLGPQSACFQGDGLCGLAGACAQGSGGRVVGECELLIAQVPGHIRQRAVGRRRLARGARPAGPARPRRRCARPAAGHAGRSGNSLRILANISPTPHPASAQATGQTGGLLADIGRQTSGHYAPLPQLESVRSLPTRRSRTLGVSAT